MSKEKYALIFPTPLAHVWHQCGNSMGLQANLKAKCKLSTMLKVVGKKFGFVLS